MAVSSVAARVILLNKCKDNNLHCHLCAAESRTSSATRRSGETAGGTPVGLHAGRDLWSLKQAVQANPPVIHTYTAQPTLPPS